jgi:hypothetical protein
MSTSRAPCTTSKFTSCSPRSSGSRLGFWDVDSTRQRHREILDLGSDIAQFHLALGAAVDRFWTSCLSWAASLSMIGDLANTISRGSTAVLFWAVWLIGTTLMFTPLGLRLAADHRDAPAAAYQSALSPKPSFLARGVPVRFADGQEAPAVDGVLRPHISHSRHIRPWPTPLITTGRWWSTCG